MGINSKTSNLQPTTAVVDLVTTCPALRGNIVDTCFLLLC